MIDIAKLQNDLCHGFCSAISINTVPCGFAVSTAFADSSGDRLGLFVVQENGGYRLEDSGDFLPTLVASGIDIEAGQRSILLEQVLQDGNAYWDRDTFEIKTDEFSEADLPNRVFAFLSALIRARDVTLLTREMVRSTFREDAMRILEERYSGQFVANENAPIDKSFNDFPADVVLRSKETDHAAALYFVSNTEKLLEAQLMLEETQRLNRGDINVIALLEKLEKVSVKKFQRAQNRGLNMPIYDGDEEAAIQRVGKVIGLTHRQSA